MTLMLAGVWTLTVAGVAVVRIAPRWPGFLEAWKLPATLSPSLATHWTDVTMAGGWLVLFACGALAGGRALAGWAGIRPARGERIPVRLLAGIAVHAAVALALGALGLLFPVVAAAAVAWLIVGARPGRLAFRAAPEALPPLGRTCRAVTLGAGAFLLLVALAPQWFVDTLAYHLAAPAHFNKLHRWVDTPHSTYRYTLLAEHYLGQALLTGGETLAGLLHACAEFLVAWLGFAWVTRLSGRAAGWAAAASLLACLPLGVILKHDVFSVGFAFLAAWAALARGGAPARASLVLAGAAAGWSFCAKYTAGAIAAGIAAGVVALPRRADSFSRLRPVVAGFWAGAAPWLVKTWLFTGNPFFSFVFDGTQWNGENHAAVAAFGCPGYSWSPSDPRGIVLSLLAMVERELPFVLLALPALLRPLPGARAGYIAAGVSAAMLVLGAPCERLLVPVVPLATVLAAVHLAARTPVLAAGPLAWAPALLIAAASAGAHGELSFGRRPLAAALGLESRAVFRERVLTTFARAARDLEALIPDDERLLVVGDSRGYLFRQVALTRDITDTSLALRLARRSSDPDRIRVRFRQRRIGYVLFNYVSAEYRGYFKGPIFRWKEDELHRHWTFWRRHSTRVPFETGDDGENGGFVLYRVHDRPREDDRTLAFLPGATAVGLRWPGENAETALARLAGVVRAAPGVVLFELNYCRLLCEAGRFAEAERRLAGCLDAPYPRLDQVHALLGVALLRRGAVERAHDHFRRAVALRPQETAYLALVSATGWHASP